jgi:hypothetical protein
MQLEFDLSASKAARDRGAGLAEDHAGPTWNQRAVEIALSFLKAAGPDGAMFEDIRSYASLLGLPEPPHPNAWGAVALSMSRRKLIVKTGVWINSSSVAAHARAAPIWRLA